MRVGWCSDHYMFAVYGTNTIGKIPTSIKSVFNLMPILFFWYIHVDWLKNIPNGLANIVNT